MVLDHTLPGGSEDSCTGGRWSTDNIWLNVAARLLKLSPVVNWDDTQVEDNVIVNAMY